MSKRQSDYLSSLLGSPSSQPTEIAPSVAALSPIAPKASMTLLQRESALARVATGEVKQVTQLLLDPARVRIWPGNPRHQASLTEDNCRDLIDAILAENGQKVPAIVRRVTGDPGCDYEVIAGSRRHWAISWLRANNYPEMMFLAQVYGLDDEAAFRLSDIENRARKDVSDFERAKTYLQALDLHYGGKQVKMAERLRLSKGWLSKLLSVASLPEWAVAAFSSPADIQLKTCYPLAQKITALAAGGDTAAIKSMRTASAALAAKQALQHELGRTAVPAADVVKSLLAASEPPQDEAGDLAFSTADGRVALSVLSSNRNGVSLRLHAGSGASEAELARLFKTCLMELEKQGRGLRA